MPDAVVGLVATGYKSFHRQTLRDIACPLLARHRTASLGMGGQCALTNELTGAYDLEDSSLVSCLVSLCRHPSLLRLLEAWPKLSAEQKQQIHSVVLAVETGE